MALRLDLKVVAQVARIRLGNLLELQRRDARMVRLFRTTEIDDLHGQPIMDRAARAGCVDLLAIGMGARGRDIQDTFRTLREA